MLLQRPNLNNPNENQQEHTATTTAKKNVTYTQNVSLQVNTLHVKSTRRACRKCTQLNKVYRKKSKLQTIQNKGKQTDDREQKNEINK